MPRILTRLLQKLAKEPLELAERPVGVEHTRRRRRQRLHRPFPERPSFIPAGRKESILRDVDSPITNPKLYIRHKSPSPRLRTQGRESDHHDYLREMDTQEREWWASPYLRMLSSPLRLCWLTSRYLPKDFMIRLAPKRLPSLPRASVTKYLLPDGLEHPRFRTRNSGRASYVVCWKLAVEHLAERGTYKSLSPNLTMHPLVVQQIGHLLRVRVLQELEFLADQLQTRPLGATNHPVLRRLTRGEFKHLKTTGVVPDRGAIAVLVVPPLNRDPITRARTLPSSSPAQVDKEISRQSDTTLQRSNYPISTLYPTTHSSENPTDFQEQSRGQVPLYNGVSLFPFRPQRAALHACLLRLLSIEQRARRREGQLGRLLRNDMAEKPADDDGKASHAFLLRSDGEIALRADSAATAIALWRLRMWEGFGWEESTTADEGWVQVQS